MAPPKVVSGQRALVYATPPGGGPPTLVGTFSSFSYNVALDVQPANILGRFTAAALEYTGYEPVSCNANGWRVVGSGPHVTPGVPKLQDMLLYEDMKLTVIDRVTNQTIATITEVKPQGYQAGFTARQLSEVGMPFTGLLCTDESGDQNESAGAANLP